MKPLVKLYGMKKWASIRNIFSRPLSAILTALVLVGYGAALVPVFMPEGKQPLDELQHTVVVWMVLVVVLMLAGSLFLSKHKALFFEQDSYYMFIGPFTRRNVLSVLLMDVTLSALMLGAMSLVMALFSSMNYAVGVGVLGQLALASILACYCITGLMDYIYLRGLIRGRQGKGFILTVAALAAIIAVVAFISIAQENFEIQAGFNNMFTGKLFYAVPVFGWIKLAADGAYTGNVLWALLGYGLLFASCAAVSLALLYSKGDFFEQAMIDAENFTEYYAKAKQGKVETDTAKLRKANVTFRPGAGALLSKALLTAKKGKLIRLTDLISIAIYAVLAVFIDMGILGLFGFVLFWLYLQISSSDIADDLKHHYVYLIPAKPFAKLVNLLALPVLKIILLSSIALVGGGLVLGAALPEIALYLVLSVSFCVLLAAGNVFSLRVMKSRNNMLVEYTLRMLVVLVALLPSGGLLWLFIALDVLSASLIILVLAGVNLLVGLLFLALCAPMLNGRELGSD